MQSILSTVSGLVLTVGYIAALALHIFTCYIAYKVGFVVTILTFAFPFVSEVYWFFAVWFKTGQFLNLYTLACLGVALLFGVGLGGSALAEKMERPRGDLGTGP